MVFNPLKKYYAIAAFALAVLNIQAQPQPLGIAQNLPAVPQAATYAITGWNAAQLDAADNAPRPGAQPLCVGRTVPVQFTPANSGQWLTVNGGRLWRLKITAAGARGITLYGKVKNLPPGAILTLYNPAGTEITDCYTAASFTRHPVLATGILTGQEGILEYFEPAGQTGKGNFTIEKIGYIYRSEPMRLPATDDFGSSASCEVNVNCSEGDDWHDQRSAVVRVRVLSDITIKWCSGTLVNNTRGDFKPYILSAMHCALNLSDTVLLNDTLFNYWIFNFNYEGTGCTNPSSADSVPNDAIVGAQVVAHSDDRGGERGSDFILMELNQQVPLSFNAYYAGWSLDTIVPMLTGVSIHHPQGDIKKISTYNWPLTPTAPYSTSPDKTHWQVLWAETDHGHGVTEGGSSGSPLFNSNKLLVGTLTGGNSSCNNTTAADAYGRMDYHWTKNGSAPNRRLKDWLDPENTGTDHLGGAYRYPDGIEEITGNQLVLQPNPAADRLLYSCRWLQNNETHTVIVTDILGRQVLQNNNPGGILPVGSLETGIYYIEVVQGSHIFTGKFIKQ